MLLAVTVAAKLDCFNDSFEFANNVGTEVAAFPRKKLYIIFGAAVASLPNVGGSVVVYDGVANAFASRPGDCNDSVGGIVVVATDCDDRHLRVSHSPLNCGMGESSHGTTIDVNYFAQKSFDECSQDGKGLGTKNTALIHTHARTRTVQFQVTTLFHPTHLYA